MDKSERISAALDAIREKMAERNTLQERLSAAEAARDAIRADMLALLSPLDKLGALLPDKVKQIINKYRG